MKQPVLFIGHGSPMNALADNHYSETLKHLGEKLLVHKPKAILMISAHWETDGTFFTSDEKPVQIFDMHGFPEDLYKVKYQPVGFPKMFGGRFPEIHPSIELGQQHWGIDHGAWSILVHLFPNADIPVVQLSIDTNKSFQQHYELGKKIAALRDENILIIGSGNIVHNLRNFDWKENAPVMDWSFQFDQWIHENVLNNDDPDIINNWNKHPYGKMSVPTPEHFAPLVYCLGASSNENPEIRDTKVIFDEIQNGSIAMRSYLFS